MADTYLTRIVDVVNDVGGKIDVNYIPGSWQVTVTYGPSETKAVGEGKTLPKAAKAALSHIA